MSNPPRQFGGHGKRFDVVADSADPKMAYAPKGTLKLRPMTSRAGGYNPDAVNPNRGYGYEPHGSDFLHNNTGRSYARDKKGPIVQQFFSPENKKLITDAVMKSLQEKTGSKLTTQNVPGYMVDMAMRKAFEIFGDTAENAPHAQVGPSESMPWLAPPEKYGDGVKFNVGLYTDDSIAKMNMVAARLLKENIVSEKALLSRYHADLGGAIHVLEYPSRPGPELRRGNQINFSYYEDISSAPYSGISGNKLGTGTQGTVYDQSVRAGPPSFRPTPAEYDDIVTRDPNPMY